MDILKIFSSFWQSFIALLFVMVGKEPKGSEHLETPSHESKFTSPLLVTPFLLHDQVSLAREKAMVTPDLGGLKSYSGFFTVDQTCGNHLFFWFVLSSQNWEEAPLVFWLNGGPGGSSLFGLFHEIGPWRFKDGKLITNEFSWHGFANLLFVDQPVGTGFSFSEKNCFATKKENVSEALYSVIIQFFKIFPELLTSKLFLAVMSFAGHYVPETAVYIDEKNQVSEFKINLAGILVGSPSIDTACDSQKGDLLYELGIAGEQERDALNKIHELFTQYLKLEDWEMVELIDSNMQSKLVEIGLPDYYNILSGERTPQTYEFSSFVTNPNTKAQLHIGDSSQEYKVINTEVYKHYKIPYFGDSSAQAIKYLFEKNFIVGFMYGQLDAICTFNSFNCAFEGLKWEGFNNYLNSNNEPLHISNRLAGWFKVFKNLFTVLFRNSGHNIPEDQGEAMFVLVKAILNSTPESLEEKLKTIK